MTVLLIDAARECEQINQVQIMLWSVFVYNVACVTHNHDDDQQVHEVEVLHANQ